MMVLTLPFVYPVITTLGFDGVWFGVVLVILVETALLTPPVGLNVFVIHGLVPHRPVGGDYSGKYALFLYDARELSHPNCLSWYSYLAT